MRVWRTMINCPAAVVLTKYLSQSMQTVPFMNQQLLELASVVCQSLIMEFCRHNDTGLIGITDVCVGLNKPT